LFGQLLGPLHRGEASCLAIAAQRGWAFLTDDARARKAATELNVTVSGTLGVLTQAVKADLLPMDEANRVLAQMIDRGYYSPYSTLVP
jgi:predicted nucleic acid-binding protein